MGGFFVIKNVFFFWKWKIFINGCWGDIGKLYMSCIFNVVKIIILVSVYVN